MALEGWILVAFIIAVVLVVIKAINKKQAIAVKLTVVMFVFAAISIGYVFISNDVDLTSFRGFASAIGLYFSWIGNIGSNFGGLSGYVIGQDWGLNTTDLFTNVTANVSG